MKHNLGFCFERGGRMKCTMCKFYNICKGRLNETVENCVRFKSVEQTNEEWLKGLSTKRMANFLSRVANKCNDCGVDSLGDMDVKCPYNCGFCNKNAVEEWLKKPHEVK